MMDASAPITTLVLDLDALAANVMAEWHIPGLALAVLRRDAPPLLQAFGFTDIEGRTRVETTTLFPIGSITKSFTATGLGLLVDEGKLGWDVPVREILAEFKLKDPRRKRKVHPARPADPPHRPAAPRLGSHARASRQCRRAGSVASPRSEPGIPQRLPNTRTLCIWWQAWWRSASPGNPWEDFIRARILDPLGMANTTTSLEEMVSSTQTTLRRMCFRKTCFLGCRCGQSIPGPAVASARPLPTASYLRFHLDPIADRGGPRLSADAATQLTAPQMYVRRSDFSEIGDVHYGLGFEVAHYRGERLIVHGGAWSGYTCDLRMLPDRGFGVVVLTTGDWHYGCPVLSHPILDRLLGLDPQPWFDRLSGPAAALRAQRRKEIAVRRPPSEWVRAQARTLRTTPANVSIQPMASCASPPTTLRCAGRDSALTCRSRIDTTICLSSVPTGASGSITRPCNYTLTGRGHRKPRPAAGTCSRADRLP